MASSLDALNPPQSLSARRSATLNMPAMELPLPPPSLSQLSNAAQKYPPFPILHATQSQPAPSNGAGNLLTPPAHGPSDSLSPLSSGPNSGSTGATTSVQSHAPNTYWPTGMTAYGYGTGTTPQGWNNQGNSMFPKSSFSPSLSILRNNGGSPTSTDNLPPPPLDPAQLPPFGSAPVTMAASSNSMQSTHQQPMATAFMNTSNQMPQTTQASSMSEYYSQRAPPTPNYYGGPPASSNPQQHSFSAYAGQQQSPLGSSGPISRMSPLSQNPGQPSMGTQAAAQFARSYPGYPLPAMAGPIMSNVTSPGHPMSLVGGMHGGMVPGFNSGHAAHMQQIYGGHPAPHQTSQNDRPFKCDQCPQGFNRNHDLKRHKRIHLAVKPFPCDHCDKSFSRKDALKRHVLVKGCGKDTKNNENSVDKGDGGTGGSKRDSSSDADTKSALSANHS
ncbi:MAG: hypothetical protein M1834_009244 [Cirrosporium novae-zelandiae]|nr:MAG: hypothetical protein M1834_009244 [Cirrosporium novae-zelandiae]